MTAEDPSQKPHFHRRLAAAGKAFKDLLPALPRPGSMRTRAMLYRFYVVPALLYAVPETCGLTDHQLQPLVGAHNAYLRRITGMGRRPEGTLHPTAQMCAAAGVPQLMHVLNAARLTRLGHVARMPDESVVKQLLFADRIRWRGR